MTSQAIRRSRPYRAVVCAAAVSLAGVAACTAAVGDRAPRGDEISTGELAAQNGRCFRGPANVVIEAARAHGNLSAEQDRQISVIAAELELDRGNHRELREKLRAAAAAVVRSGTAGSQGFEESVGDAVGAVERRMQKSSDAVEEIHGMLDAEQRAAVAAALRARIEERFGSANRRDGRHQGRFERIAKKLALSATQVQKLQAMKKELLGDGERLRPNREELLELVDAFEGDDFRAALNAFRARKSALLRERLSRAGERADTALSLLTAEQRDLLADLIENGPEKTLAREWVAKAEADRD